MKNILKFDKFISEGSSMKANTTKDNDVKIELMRNKIENYLKSLEYDIKQVGDDLEAHSGDEHILQVMMRPNYIGVKKVGNKFPKEFKYNELGKIKKIISSYTK